MQVIHCPIRSKACRAAAAAMATLKPVWSSLPWFERQHARRTARVAVRLGRDAGLSDGELCALRTGALLHDIGKALVARSILLKPGPLTSTETARLRQHPLLGALLMRAMPSLRLGSNVVLFHHERWDGGGYPCGRRGDDIPLLARILGVVDVWDALLSDRPYRPRLTEAETRQILLREAGFHFDPRLVEIFLKGAARVALPI